MCFLLFTSLVTCVVTVHVVIHMYVYIRFISVIKGHLSEICISLSLGLLQETTTK